MSNCPRLDKRIPDHANDINIKVVDINNSGTNYIEYHLTKITEIGCQLSFKINNKTKDISSEINFSFNDKPLSVVNVLRYMIYTINRQIGSIPGSNLQEKLDKFITLIDDDFIYNYILPIFCIKLMGDLGQELFAVAKNKVLASNDRPSAMRYMLMKILSSNKVGDKGGGGYFPNKNPFYI